MKTVHDLSWGDPFCVRQALEETLGGHGYGSWEATPEDMGYPPHYGMPALIEQLKDLAHRQSGHRPKHLIVTCGATGAINAALHALKTTKTGWVVTNKRRFPLYPAIIGLTDMIMIDRSKRDELCNSSNGCSDANFISLVDSPSAPEGIVSVFEDVDIWDAAYASRTYGNVFLPTPLKYRVMCGSLSKTLGLAGLRLGWASTDEDFLADSIKNYVKASYAGLSSVSMGFAEGILRILDIPAFELLSGGYVDDNRGEIQRVLVKFGQPSVPVRGMFAILELGKAEKRALEKANIKWLPGPVWGESESWARLSLGQTREVTRAAVKSV